jgi:uncharacterized coiled-coil DUF342 family protein
MNEATNTDHTLDLLRGRIDALLKERDALREERDALKSTVLTSDAAYDSALEAALRQHTHALKVGAERDALREERDELAADRDELRETVHEARTMARAARERLADVVNGDLHALSHL